MILKSTAIRLAIAVSTLSILGFGGVEHVALADDAAPGAVTMQSNSFVLNTLTVPIGTTVTWTNLDGEDHDVVTRDLVIESPPIPAGTSWSYTFATPGTYNYMCDLHANMEATITVTG